MLSSLMLSCDLIALPDELLLSCVDKSLRTCVMLAGTSKAIRAKLSYQAKARSRAAQPLTIASRMYSFSLRHLPPLPGKELPFLGPPVLRTVT